MYVEGALSTRGTYYPAHATSTRSLSPHTISNHRQYLEYQAHRNHFHNQYHRSFSPLVSTRRSILAQFANRCGSMPFPTKDSGSIDFACAIDDSTQASCTSLLNSTNSARLTFQGGRGGERGEEHCRVKPSVGPIPHVAINAHHIA